MCKTRWKTIPDVEEFEGIEQHTFLHIVINLLICPKARSSIDLSGKREQTHSKDALYFFLFLVCFISLFSPFLSVQQTGMLRNYRSEFRASLEKRKKRSIPTRRGVVRGRWKLRVFSLFDGHFATLSLCLGINPLWHWRVYARAFRRAYLRQSECTQTDCVG